MTQTFTALGAARFLQDIIAIQAVVDGSCLVYRQASADLEMDKLKQGVVLLNLPLEDEVCTLILSNISKVLGFEKYRDTYLILF